jgi:hypothetical protein
MKETQTERKSPGFGRGFCGGFDARERNPIIIDHLLNLLFSILKQRRIVDVIPLSSLLL